MTVRDVNIQLRAELRDPGRQGSDAFREPLSLSRQATVHAASNAMDEDMEPASPPIIPQSSHRVVVPDLQTMRASLPLTTAPPPPTQGAAATTAQPSPTHVRVPMSGQPPPTQTAPPPPMQVTAPMSGQPPATHVTLPMTAPPPPMLFRQPPPMQVAVPITSPPPPTMPMFGHQPPPTQGTTLSNRRKQIARPRGDPICGRCGRPKRSDPKAAGLHSNRVAKDHWRYCQVAPVDYIPGFPWPDYVIRISPDGNNN